MVAVIVRGVQQDKCVLVARRFGLSRRGIGVDVDAEMGDTDV